MNAKGKILIIDDNEDVLFALNLLLDPYVEKIKVTTQPTRIEHFMTTFQPDVIEFSSGCYQRAGRIRLSRADTKVRSAGYCLVYDCLCGYR